MASDHVIELPERPLADPTSRARNGPGAVEQIPIFEDALEALGVTVWKMVEVEADDALGAAAAVAAADDRVEQVIICTPDKDLGQCVVGDRVVQLDRRKDVITDEDGVIEKFGVGPASIPDYLALVGDTADGFPGPRAGAPSPPPGSWPAGAT
ncbi:MAG: hypothetical protein R2715_06625 [Ilumatobacteraceae bacterium]